MDCANHLYTHTHTHTHTLVLFGFRTLQTLYSSHLDQKKNVSALSAYSELIALDRSCMSHNATLLEKMLHRLVFVGFGIHHKF